MTSPRRRPRRAWYVGMTLDFLGVLRDVEELRAVRDVPCAEGVARAVCILEETAPHGTARRVSARSHIPAWIAEHYVRTGGLDLDLTKAPRWLARRFVELLAAALEAGSPKKGSRAEWDKGCAALLGSLAHVLPREAVPPGLDVWRARMLLDAISEEEA